MRILSMKAGHGGTIAFIEDGRLVYSLEGEKDSGDRYGAVSARAVLQAMEMAPGHPDVLAVGGWYKPLPGYVSQYGAKDLLNTIKQREGYRPIAPCCIAEDLGLWFDDPIEDPYMLYFSNVRTDALPAVTHVDGTARIQSVRRHQEPTLYQLLESFQAVSGYGVLCNTSLNFSGHGFINRMSDLIGYCELKNISDVIVDDTWYQRR